MRHYVYISLMLCVFGYIKASEAEEFIKNEKYKIYFQQQEEIYEDLLRLGIPGARPLNMDELLAESVLANCPQEVDEVISDIEHRLFSTNKKNIIFHGPSGTGKSAMAQAIAIKTQTPCLFFNTGTISTEYKDSGVQNLSKIFKYAQEVEKKSGKPCVVILDELEALTKKHVGTNHSENNILVSFWQELDKLAKSKVIAIGTMNNTEDVPDQIINRTSMIEVPLPNLEQKIAILSYLSKKRQDQYKLVYPEWLTPSYLARKTKGFSNRDLENLVEQATRPVIKASAPLDGSCKIVPSENFDRGIKKIQWQFIEKWQRTFKKHLRDAKITIPLVGIAVMFGVGYNTILNQRRSFDFQKQSMDMQNANHKESIALQKEGMALQIANQKENVAMQREAMAQAQQIADYQMSTDHMMVQAKINSVPWDRYFCEWIDPLTKKLHSISSASELSFFGISLRFGGNIESRDLPKNN